MMESRVLGPKTGPERQPGYQINIPPTTFTADIWPVGGGEMNAIIRQVGAWCEQSPTVVQYSPKVQAKEQLALKKNKWSLIIDMTRVIGEFGRPASV